MRVRWAHMRVSRIHLDTYSTLHIDFLISEAYPDHAAACPDHAEAYPDHAEACPDHAEAYPDHAEAWRGYLRPRAERAGAEVGKQDLVWNERRRRWGCRILCRTSSLFQSESLEHLRD